MGETGSTSGSTRGSNRKSKAAAKAMPVNRSVDNAVEQEETMAEQDKNAGNGEAAEAGAKAGKLELAKKPEANGTNESGLVVRKEEGEDTLHTGFASSRPIGAGAIQVAEQFTAAGLRPIASSNLEVFGTILNNRPILASHLQVVEYAIPGNRPIFASEIVVRDDLTLPGGRPIIASDPHLLEASLLPGGRPIASNEIDDSETLMGFID